LCVYHCMSNAPHNRNGHNHYHKSDFVNLVIGMLVIEQMVRCRVMCLHTIATMTVCIIIESLLHCKLYNRVALSYVMTIGGTYLGFAKWSMS
jgi:hypothetical protein